MKILGEGSNSNLKIDQLAPSIVNSYLRTRECQYLVMKEWIRGSTNLCDLKSTNARIISKPFQLTGVYDDTTEIIGRQQKKPIYVCKNTIMIIFNFGNFKFKSLKDDIENSSAKSHGFKK